MNEICLNVPELARERHRDLLLQAEAGRQARRLRTLRRAARRASRAERSLSKARYQVLRTRSQLTGSR